jgi:hypothetical protein
MSDAPPRPEKHPLLRQALFLLGIVLIIASPLVGAIPGPGGVVVFAAGLGLVLKYTRLGQAPVCPLQARPSQQGPLGRLGHAPAERAPPRGAAARRQVRSGALGD